LGTSKATTVRTLIIGYKMYNDSLSFNGYNQPDIEEWVKSQKEDLDYDRQKYNLKTGTLLIQFFDRRQNRSIWQGYATTLYGSIDFGNQRHLKNAVNSPSSISIGSGPKDLWRKLKLPMTLRCSRHHSKG
jgi:hypothetical protein